MGDRTNLQVTVHACAEDKRGRIWTAIADTIGEPDFGEGPPQDGLVALGEQYGANEVSCGSASELSRQLIEIDPTIVFMLWEDPKYEWLGEVVIYVPELGLWRQECTAEGSAVLYLEQVDATGILQAGLAPDELSRAQEKLRDLYGYRWHEYVQKHYIDIDIEGEGNDNTSTQTGVGPEPGGS